MSSRILISLFVLCSALLGQETGDPIERLEAWIELARAARPAIGEQEFARTPLSRKQAEKARELMIGDLAARLREERAAEWKGKKLRIGELEMAFEYRVFGEAKEGRRSLFISMHGGGSAPKATNDQQWRNQIRLYEPEEGIYLAPRAPTDSWNMWHQEHIDGFFERIIEDAVLFAGASFDRVYLLGYSAGGDGVYQLAPRMADHFAAAAMMAGHPNETRPLGLRNLPFTIHMGEKDAAFKRNEVAVSWKEQLARLREADPEGYAHEVVIHAGKGHWMDREDAVALPWMTKHGRQRRPKRVVWLQDDVVHDRFYWLGLPAAERKAGVLAEVSISEQRVTVAETTTARALTVYLDDDLLDLDRPVSLITTGGEKRTIKPERTILTIAETLDLDPAAVFFSRVSVETP